LVHHSHGHAAEGWIGTRPVKRLLVYHNITPPEHFAPGSPHRAWSILGREMLPRYREWIAGALCDSDHNADELRGLGYADVRTLPLLFDLDALRRALSTPPDDRSPGFRLLFVGRIAANKCQHDLLLVAWHLRRFGPVRLVLVGSSPPGDPYRAYLDAMVGRLGLADPVTFAGHVADDALRGWYRWADAFLCLSEHEGFGVPLIEAMTAGKPVVAYRSSAVPGTVGPGGLIVEEKDHARLAALLAALHEDEPARAAIRAGQEARLRELSRERLKEGLARFLIDHGVALPGTGRRAA
ncbi:MAG: glycosyltransferase family 4 protein, partial [Gemmataceae bacterium]|nr:glycosyltransferase family 4 protein [Gemmataceae bacterium]